MAPTVRNGNARRRVMIVGFDGATLDLIRPWAEAGLLPTFKRLMDESAWGELQSTIPPVTPAAWNTMATGLNPGKHGLFDFFRRIDGSYETTVVNTTHRHGAPLWSLLSQAGYRVAVFNVPASYPPDRVNGTMVSGLLTPSGATDAAYPRELQSELKQAIPDFGFYPPGIFSKGQEARFVQDVLDWDAMTLRGTEFVMQRDDWDFLFTVFSGVDIMCHVMWKEMESKGTSVESQDPAVKQRLANAIQSVYRQADGITAHLLQAAGEDTTVIVVSDHGFGLQENYVHLNAWLESQGYLKFKRTPFIFAKYIAYRLGVTPLRVLEFIRRLGLGGQVKQAAGGNRASLDGLIKRAFLSFADVDWSRTLAYSAGFGAPIFVNLKGREPQGIISPGSEYDGLLDRLTADLRSLKNPRDGTPFVDKIYRGRDLFPGPYVAAAPDLLFEPRDWRDQGYGLHDLASNRWIESSGDHSGTHRMNGIVFARGPDIRPGYRLQGASIHDIAPTVLARMSVPIPDNLDGRVLNEMFAEPVHAQMQIAYRSADDVDGDGHANQPVMSEEEESVIRERLEALGYFG